jgi:hypothetical protein
VRIVVLAPVVSGGSFNALKVGQDGKPGQPCTFSPPPGTAAGYLAVKLDYELKIGSIGAFAKGDVVPLCRIRSGHVSLAEPITETNGCTGIHLHARAGTPGITIRALSALSNVKPQWRRYAPFKDEDPKHCGYGKLVVIPKCEIQAKDARLK